MLVHVVYVVHVVHAVQVQAHLTVLVLPRKENALHHTCKKANSPFRSVMESCSGVPDTIHRNLEWSDWQLFAIAVVEERIS